MPVVLNVGGGSKSYAIPKHYDGWDHVILDVDPKANPDIVCDARKLEDLNTEQYFDAVYCAHNLEHYYRHDVAKVLSGFRHVLKADGFAEIRVPDLESVLRRVVESNMGLEDTLYESALGPVAPLDVLYGLGCEIEQSGQDYYAHKTGFTPKSLRQAAENAGFPVVFNTVAPCVFEARVLAFMSEPKIEHRELLGLPGVSTAPVDVTIERGRVQTGRVEIILRRGAETVSTDNHESWPFENNSVDHIRCEHLLEYLNGVERMWFMQECGRVLKLGGTLLITFYYATSRQASCDPMFQWPPLTEFSFNYFSRNWRETNNCPYRITCDLDFSYKCDLEPSLTVRHNEAKNFSTKHYNQSVIKMHGLMTKRS